VLLNGGPTWHFGSGYSCAYIAEKRVLNKAGGGVISCRKLEETAFRYEHGEPIYLNCSIMSWF